MAEVVCDTSFLIHLASGRTKNVSELDRLGPVRLVVPEVVISELELLLANPAKSSRAQAALTLARTFRTVPIAGDDADTAIAEHVRKSGGIVATMDRELKLKIKRLGGSVISFANDRIVLE